MSTTVWEGTLRFDAGGVDVDFHLGSWDNSNEYIDKVTVTNTVGADPSSGYPQLLSEDSHGNPLIQLSSVYDANANTDDYDTAWSSAESYVLKLDPSKSYTLTITEN